MSSSKSSEEVFQELLEEKNNHIRNRKNILRELGYMSIYNKNQRISNQFSEIEEIFSNIKEKLYGIIHKKTKKKNRIGIKNRITIRDGTVYQYSNSTLANLRTVADNKEEICNKCVEREDRRKIEEILSMVKNLEENKPVAPVTISRGIKWWIGKEPFMECEDKKYILYRYPSGKFGRGKVYIKEGYDNYYNIDNDDINYRESIDISSMDYEKARQLSGVKDDLNVFLEEVEEIVKNKKEEVIRIEEHIDDVYSSELVLERI